MSRTCTTTIGQRAVRAGRWTSRDRMRLLRKPILCAASDGQRRKSAISSEHRSRARGRRAVGCVRERRSSCGWLPNLLGVDRARVCHRGCKRFRPADGCCRRDCLLWMPSAAQHTRPAATVLRTSSSRLASWTAHHRLASSEILVAFTETHTPPQRVECDSFTGVSKSVTLCGELPDKRTCIQWDVCGRNIYPRHASALHVPPLGDQSVTE